MKVFLDLEGTLIDSWFNPKLLTENIRKIKLFLHIHKISEVDIFSYAVLNVEDYKNFLKMEEALEMSLGTEIDEIHLGENILTTVSRYTNLVYENWLDFTSVTYKHQVFYDYCLARASNFNTSMCILIDDVVPTRMVVNYKPNTAALTLNIRDIEDFYGTNILELFGS